MRTTPLAPMVLGAGLALLGHPSPVDAALDPETGSYVFQVVATVVVAGGFALRAGWPRLRARLTRPGVPPRGPDAG